MKTLIEAHLESHLKMRCKVCGKSIRPSENHVKVYQEGMHHEVCCAVCGEIRGSAGARLGSSSI